MKNIDLILLQKAVKKEKDNVNVYYNKDINGYNVLNFEFNLKYGTNYKIKIKYFHNKKENVIEVYMPENDSIFKKGRISSFSLIIFQNVLEKYKEKVNAKGIILKEELYFTFEECDELYKNKIEEAYFLTDDFKIKSFLISGIDKKEVSLLEKKIYEIKKQNGCQVKINSNYNGIEMCFEFKNKNFSYIIKNHLEGFTFNEVYIGRKKNDFFNKLDEINKELKQYRLKELLNVR